MWVRGHQGTVGGGLEGQEGMADAYRYARHCGTGRNQTGVSITPQSADPPRLVQESDKKPDVHDHEVGRTGTAEAMDEGSRRTTPRCICDGQTPQNAAPSPRVLCQPDYLWLHRRIDSKKNFFQTPRLGLTLFSCPDSKPALPPIEQVDLCLFFVLHHLPTRLANSTWCAIFILTQSNTSMVLFSCPDRFIFVW